MNADNNFLLDHSHQGQRKSISMDIVLFRLFSVHVKGDAKAKIAIKGFMEESWGQHGFSRLIQRRVLAEVCRPSLVLKVYGEDKFSQKELEL